MTQYLSEATWGQIEALQLPQTLHASNIGRNIHIVLNILSQDGILNPIEELLAGTRKELAQLEAQGQTSYDLMQTIDLLEKLLDLYQQQQKTKSKVARDGLQRKMDKLQGIGVMSVEDED